MLALDHSAIASLNAFRISNLDLRTVINPTIFMLTQYLKYHLGLQRVLQNHSVERKRKSQREKEEEEDAEEES
jgi:hypothetical protein